jgi:DNA-binding CsgD family transcriptional regulator
MAQTIILSLRETEVAQLMALGHTSRQIAQFLFVSNNTVRTHLQHIRQKTNCHNKTTAIAALRQAGIIK